MTKIRIPDQYKNGLKQLFEFSIKEISHIGEVICKIEPGAGPTTFFKGLKAKLNDRITPDIAQTIFGFGSLMNEENLKNIEELAEGLVQSYQSQISKINKEEAEIFKSKLLAILNNCENLRITYKIYILITENEKLLETSKIISDIRLIFKENIDDKAELGMILHKLKLEYQSNSEFQNFYVNLNKEQLEKLKKDIDRALAKDESIRKNYNNINFFEVKE